MGELGDKWSHPFFAWEVTMAAYHVPEFTAEQRADAALRILIPFPDRQ
jgi:hypothetical protein